MAPSSDSAPSAGDLRRASLKLSDMVTTIELTMISVIAGLMLFPLMDYTTPLIREARIEYWVYPLVCVAEVMFFWTAVIAHAVTFIGWPIDVAHNLLYLIVFPLVGIQMHFMSEPAYFFALLLLTTVVSVCLVIYDLRTIAEKIKNAAGATKSLYAVVYGRQARLCLYTAFGSLVSAVMFALVLARPDLFLAERYHVVLGVALLGYILFLLFTEYQQLMRIRTRVLFKTAEEMTLADKAAGPLAPMGVPDL